MMSRLKYSQRHFTEKLQGSWTWEQDLNSQHGSILSSGQGCTFAASINMYHHSLQEIYIYIYISVCQCVFQRCQSSATKLCTSMSSVSAPIHNQMCFDHLRSCIKLAVGVNRTFLANLLVAMCLGSQLTTGTLFQGLCVLAVSMEDIWLASRRMKNN